MWVVLAQQEMTFDFKFGIYMFVPDFGIHITGTLKTYASRSCQVQSPQLMCWFHFKFSNVWRLFLLIFQFLTNHHLQVFRDWNNVSPNKCNSFVNLLNRILKICIQCVASPFSLFFNIILSCEVPPVTWRTVAVTHLHKTGSQTVA